MFTKRQLVKVILARQIWNSLTFPALIISNGKATAKNNTTTDEHIFEYNECAWRIVNWNKDTLRGLFIDVFGKG